MCSLNILYSEEAREENKALLNSSQFYVGTDGRLAFSIATDTVNYFMKSFTGHPETPGLEFYNEHRESSFTSYGKEYSVNKVLKGIRDSGLEVTTFKVKDLQWILKYDTPNPERLKKANITKPIIVVKDHGKLCAVDGLHRLTKAVAAGVTELPGYLINKDILAAALIE